MQKLLLFFLFSVCLCNIVENNDQRILVGGWQTIPNDQVPESIVQFAYNQVRSRVNHYNLNPVKIVSARMQVVAGLKYDVVSLFRSGDHEHKYRTVMWMKPNHEIEVIKVEEVGNAHAEAAKEKTNLAGGFEDITELPQNIKDFALKTVCLKSNFDAKNLSSVENIQKQIVAGWVYKFTLVFNFNNESHKFEVKVWEKLDNSLEFMDMKEITPH